MKTLLNSPCQEESQETYNSGTLSCNKGCWVSFEPDHEKTCLCHMRITKALISLISTFVVAGRYNTVSTCYIYLLYSRSFKTLASLCVWAGRFESYLIPTPRRRVLRVYLLFLSCVLYCVQFADDTICAYKVSLFLKEIVHFILIQNCKCFHLWWFWIGDIHVEKPVYTIEVLKGRKYSEKVWLLYNTCL